jgi:hypothetical protein
LCREQAKKKGSVVLMRGREREREINLNYGILLTVGPGLFICLLLSDFCFVAHKSIKENFSFPASKNKSVNVCCLCYRRITKKRQKMPTKKQKQSSEIIKILVYDITFRLMAKFIDFLLFLVASIKI